MEKHSLPRTDMLIWQQWDPGCVLRGAVVRLDEQTRGKKKGLGQGTLSGRAG